MSTPESKKASKKKGFEVRHPALEMVREYLHCPLYFRYRRAFGLEDRSPILQENHLLEATKIGVAAWFYALGRRQTKKNARARMGAAVVKYWEDADVDPNDYPLAHSRIMSLILELDKVVPSRKDLEVRKIDMDASAVFTSLIKTEPLETKVQAIYQDKRGRKRLYGVLVLPSKSYIKSPVGQIEVGAASRALGRQTGPMKGYFHFLYLDTGQVDTKPASDLKNFRAQTREILIAVSRAVMHRVYPPTGDVGKCQKCYFKKICDYSHSTSRLISSVREDITKRARAELDQEPVFKNMG